MPESLRFAVAIHVLVLLAAVEEPATSAFIAGSVRTNPVVIRRILGRLKRAGLVAGRSGPRGGFRLARPPRRISLAEVYVAVEQGGAGPRTHRPNPRCPVAKHVTGVIASVGTGAGPNFSSIALARRK